MIENPDRATDEDLFAEYCVRWRDPSRSDFAFGEQFAMRQGDRRDAAQLTAYAGVKARYLTEEQGWSDPAVRAAWRRNIASAGMTPDQFVDFLTKP